MSDKALGLILFETMEEPQGYAFIGDDMGNLSDAEVVNVARNALDWTNVGARRLRAFIRKYGGEKQ